MPAVQLWGTLELRITSNGTLSVGVFVAEKIELVCVTYRYPSIPYVEYAPFNVGEFLTSNFSNQKIKFPIISVLKNPANSLM